MYSSNSILLSYISTDLTSYFICTRTERLFSIIVLRLEFFRRTDDTMAKPMLKSLVPRTSASAPKFMNANEGDVDAPLLSAKKTEIKNFKRAISDSDENEQTNATVNPSALFSFFLSIV